MSERAPGRFGASRLRRLFDEAMAIDPSRRSAFLDEACAGESPLREEIVSLLAAYESAPEFLETGPEMPRPTPDAGDVEPVERVRIEGYEVRREIQRGGQGVVYEALQVSTRRPVAIKLLREGAWASPMARRRFEREIELAAALRHPNIITVFDSGIARGLRYYVMDYIEGLALDRYVAEKQFALEPILQLFLTICSGIAHAHQRGIIHRDLKPTNILVDSDGSPKSARFRPGQAGGRTVRDARHADRACPGDDPLPLAGAGPRRNR
jgi:hypothetical protein